VSAALYERDPGQYLAEFDAYLQGWKGSDEEGDIVGWLVYASTGEDNADIFRVVARGYITATWETWADDLGDRRIGLFENVHRKSDRDLAERGVPEGLWDLVYGTKVITTQIAEFARAGDATLADRLDLIFDQIVLANTDFEVQPNDETLGGLRNFFCNGVALYLFLNWWQAHDERGTPYPERWSDIGHVQIEEDRLAGLELPATIRGCTVDEADTLGYEIRSPGKLGGAHATAFLAEGDHASITQIVTSGRLGTRTVTVPESSHVDVLRDLGFQEATFPNGQRYRLSSWSGLSGIRKIKH
jgi:hypothetical protein